ncbi:hypothetical protein PTTG_25510 [Puccinia triticina 1-1 BBBD Race 1]|uniref:Tet-like 2OG-Fe(II) oxygenase domain-containing protein n=1 Tax=Puccinia triticina (isolate 1-1 / race 1 (BBBD)) TaxID=630390 RepID=A0A180H1Y4_PUCT1|nr:hypothetical protein PTTG_25510 [Puccinia triticina 1-1 BBBD Race 1]
MTFHPDDTDSSLSDLPDTINEESSEDEDGIVAQPQVAKKKPNDCIVVYEHPVENGVTPAAPVMTKEQMRALTKKRQNKKNNDKKRKAKIPKAMHDWITDLPFCSGGHLVWDVKVNPGQDLFSNITAELKQIKDARKLYVKECKKLKLDPVPKKVTINRRQPTTNEIEAARSIVNNPKKFRLFDRGHVTIFDKKKKKGKKQIILDATFVDIKEMKESNPEKFGKINFFLSFLHISKKFVRRVGSKGRLCAGDMWAIGWRKGYLEIEIVGQYLNMDFISQNLDEFLEHIGQAQKVSDILWDLFHPIANVAIENNREFMMKNNIPFFSDAKMPNDLCDLNPSTSNPNLQSDPEPEIKNTDSELHNEESKKKGFSSNLTFTSNGFFNHPHKDSRDDNRLPFAFLLVLPTSRLNGLLALRSDGYNVEGGEFVFPECGFGLKFNPDTMVLATFSQVHYLHGTLQPSEPDDFTKTGMSLQVSKRTTDICQRYLLQEIVDMHKKHVGDLNYIFSHAKAKVDERVMAKPKKK